MAGRPASSFVMLDLMRLPLGILSGMGFIGAGAILVWFTTVLGLCFGGGQIAFGMAGFGIGIVTISGLRYFERRMKHDRQATLTVVTTAEGPSEEEIRAGLASQHCGIASCALVYIAERATQQLTCHVNWRGSLLDTTIPGIVRALADRSGAVKVEWTPESR